MHIKENKYTYYDNKRQKDSFLILVWKILFWLYILNLFVFVIIKFNGSVSDITDRIDSYKHMRADHIWNMNLVPFRSISAQLKHITEGWAFKNIIGNIILFMPYGFLLPLAYQKYQSLRRFIPLALMSIIGIEVSQLITMLGSFDIDDILLNSIGIVFGYIAFLGLKQYTLP